MLFYTDIFFRVLVCDQLHVEEVFMVHSRRIRTVH